MEKNQIQFEALCNDCGKHLILFKSQLIYDNDFLQYKKLGYIFTICNDCLSVD